MHQARRERKPQVARRAVSYTESLTSAAPDGTSASPTCAGYYTSNRTTGSFFIDAAYLWNGMHITQTNNQSTHSLSHSIHAFKGTTAPGHSAWRRGNPRFNFKWCRSCRDIASITPFSGRVHRTSLGSPFLGFPKWHRSCQDIAAVTPFSGGYTALRWGSHSLAFQSRIGPVKTSPLPGRFRARYYCCTTAVYSEQGGCIRCCF